MVSTCDIEFNYYTKISNVRKMVIRHIVDQTNRCLNEVFIYIYYNSVRKTSSFKKNITSY